MSLLLTFYFVLIFILLFLNHGLYFLPLFFITFSFQSHKFYIISFSLFPVLISFLPPRSTSNSPSRQTVLPLLTLISSFMRFFLPLCLSFLPSPLLITHPPSLFSSSSSSCFANSPSPSYSYYFSFPFTLPQIRRQFHFPPFSLPSLSLLFTEMSCSFNLTNFSLSL